MLYDTFDFIEAALAQGGRVLVHCSQVGPGGQGGGELLLRSQLEGGGGGQGREGGSCWCAVYEYEGWPGGGQLGWAALGTAV